MTPAEFRCLREYLGLTTQWVATKLMVNPRTILVWESPNRQQDVPFHASQLLKGMRKQADEEVEALVAWIGTQKLGAVVEVPGENAWHQGEYPPTWHRAIAQRAVMQADQLRGHQVLEVSYRESEVS